MRWNYIKLQIAVVFRRSKISNSCFSSTFPQVKCTLKVCPFLVPKGIFLSLIILKSPFPSRLLSSEWRWEHITCFYLLPQRDLHFIFFDTFLFSIIRFLHYITVYHKIPSKCMPSVSQVSKTMHKRKGKIRKTECVESLRCILITQAMEESLKKLKTDKGQFT